MRAVSLFLENPWDRKERKTSKRASVTVSVTFEGPSALLAAALPQSLSHPCFAFFAQCSRKRENAHSLGNHLNWGTDNYVLRDMESRGSNFTGHVFSLLTFRLCKISFCLQKCEDTCLGIAESTSPARFVFFMDHTISFSSYCCAEMFYFDGGECCSTPALKKRMVLPLIKSSES